MRKMLPPALVKYWFLLFVLFLLSSSLYAQTAAPFVGANVPRHETLNQRVIGVIFNANLTGTTTTGQWTVRINGNIVPTSGVSNLENGVFGPSASPAANIVGVQFDASGAPGHSAATPFLLPGEVLTVSFVNTGTTLKTAGSLNNVLNFGPLTSRNTAVPTCGLDILFNSEGVASVLDQCAPVNADFFRWTYQYSLRYRNSTTWTTTNNRLRVTWGSGASQTDLSGYLSDNGGNVNASFITPTFTGGNPGVFLTFRPGFNAATLTFDGVTGAFSYPDNTNVCNFRTTHTPIGVTTAVYDCTPSPTLTRNTQFNSYDFDDQNTGQLVVDPIVPPASGTTTTDDVCIGLNVGSRFRDNSVFNCIGNGTVIPTPGQGANATPINNQQRWIRFIYGGVTPPAPGQIPDIRVGGTQVTNSVTGALLPAYVNNPLLAGGPTLNGYVPTGAGGPNVPDANGVIELTANATVSGTLSQLITTLSATNQVVGQRFYVTIQYWNVCNPYPTSQPVQSSTDYVEIVTIPPAPVAGTSPAVCNGNTPAAFNITGAVAGSTVRWYANVNGATPKVPGTVGAFITQTVANGAGASSINVTTAFPALNNTVADNYIVWASYIASPGGIACESPPVAVIRSIREALPTTNMAIKLPAAACPGASVQFVMERPAGTTFTLPTMPVGGATRLVWTVPAAVGTITSGQNTNTITVTLAGTTASGTVSAVYEYTSTPNCGSTITSGTYTMKAPPAIGTQPVNRTICAGENTTFQVSGVTGSGTLSHQWQVDTGSGFGNVVDGGVYSGAQTATLQISAAPFTMNGYIYRDVVTADAAGCSPPATSTARTLTVRPNPAITAHPQVTRTICIGGNTSFSVTATGQATLTYQWQVDTGSGFGNISNGGVYSNATTSTLNITGGTAAMDGFVYRVIVSSTTCNYPVTSNQGTLTVQGPTTAITNGASASVCAGNNLNLTATESFLNGSFATRAWTGTYDETGPPALIALSNIQLDALLTDGVGGSRRTALNPIFNSAGLGVNKTGVYVLTLTTTDNNGCPSVATITINVGQVDANILYGYTSGTITQNNLNAPICSGFDLFLNGNPTGGSGTFTTHAWSKVSGPGGAIGTLISNTAIANPVFNSTTTGTYVLNYSVTDNLGCTFTTTGKNITIVVNPLPGAVNQTPTVCSDPTTPTQATVNLTSLNAGINPGPGVTITWFTAYNPGTKVFSGAIGTPTAYVVTNAVSVFARVSDNVTSCASPATVTYTVNPTPNLVTGQTKTICSGANTAYEILLTPANSPAGTVFNWAAPTMSAGGAQGTAGTNVAMGAAGTLHINDVLVNTTGSPITATYTITPSTLVPNCAGTARTVVITVNPAPVITAGQVKTICSGQAVNKEILLTPANLPAGTRFSWPLPTMSAGGAQGSVGTNVPMGVAGTNHITDVLVNTTGAPITATYNITPNTTPAGCTGATVPVVITINPEPVITAGQVKTICSGDAVNLEILLSPANAPAGTRFSWPLPTMSAGAAQGTTGTNVPMGAAGTLHITDVLTNTTGSPITATYRVTPNTTPAGCTGAQRDIVITINPAPNITAGQVKTICSGENVNLRVLLTPNNLPAGTTFTWAAPTMSAGGAQGTGGTAVPATNALHITDALVNTTAAPITATYTIVPTSGAGCVGASRNVVITINPLPPANPIVGQGTVCAGTNIILYQVTPNAGSTYAWTIPTPLFEVFGGGGANDFFVLLRFPTVGSGNISVIETNSFPGKNCSGSSNVFPITVAPAPSALTIDGPDPVCKGQTGVVYEVPVAIFNPASTYTWTASGANIVSATSGVGLRQITVDFGLLASASITVNETSSSGCAGTPVTKNLSVGDRPSMTSASSISTCSGSTPGLTFTATPSATFNWQVITISGTIGGTAVGNSGTGNISQVLTNTTGFAGTVTYRVTPIGTAAPNCAGTPQDVIVTVNPEPVLNLTNKTICSDVAAGYEIKLNPLNLPPGTTFTWAAPTMSSGGPQGTSGTAIPMGAAGTIHINDAFVNAGTTPITATYTIQATSGLGCSSNQAAASRRVVITINPKPVGFNDATPVVCSNASVNYALASNIGNTVSGGNNLVAGTTYSWVAANNGNVTGESLAPQTSATINDVLRNVTNGDQLVVYTVTPTSSLGCVGPNFTVSVTVRPEPKGYNDATPVVCSDVALAYNLSANVANIGLGGNNLTLGTTYSWVAAPNANVAGESLAPVAGGTINDVLTNVTTLDQVVVYTVTPTSANGCVGSTFTVSVSVRPEPQGFNDNSPVICSDASVNYNNEANILNTALGGNGLITGTTYSWVAASNPNVGGESLAPQTGKFITDVLNNVTAADEAVVYTITPTSVNGCVGNPFNVTVIVHPEPRGFNDATPFICSKQSVNYSLITNIANTGSGGNNLTAGTTFSWVAASNGSVGGESTIPQTGATITDILTNSTNSNQIVVYTVTPTSAAGCVGNAFTVSITVRPEPKGHDDNTPFVCSDVAVNYDLVANVANTGLGGNNLTAGTTFSWIATSNANVGGESTTPQIGSAINDILNNVTTSNQTVTYTVTPTSSLGCVGTPFVVVITVRPEPRGFDDASPLVCSNQVMNYNLAANIANTGAGGNNLVTGTTFSWVAANNPNTTGESTTPQTSATINNNLRNTTNTNQAVVYTVTPTSADGCVGNTFTVTVTVRPEPRGFNDNTPVICSDDNVNYDLSLNIGNTVAGGNNLVTGTTYSWIATSNASVGGESTSAQSGAIINDVLNNVTTSDQTVTYTVTPTSAAGCVGGTFTVTITVRPEPRGFNDATPVVCSNATVNYDLLANVANTVSGGNNLVTGTTFSWLAANNVNVAGESTTPQAGPSITDALTNVTNANQIVVYTVTPTSASGCVGNTFTVSVTVRPEPRGFNDNTPVICSKANVNYNLATNIANTGSGGNNLVTGTTYSWIAASNGNVSGESNVTPGTSSTINDVLVNLTNGNEIVVYTVTPTSSDFCVGATFTVSVTVRPEPKGFNDATTVTCSDIAFNYDLAANIANTGSGGNNLVAGTTYSWTAAPNASVTGEGSGTTSTITDVLNNVTNSNQVVVYTVIPTSASGCVGNSFTVSITVRPEPRGYNDITPIICSDASVNYNLTANVANTGLGGNNLTAGTLYSWIATANASVTGESDVTPGTGATITDVLTNVTNSNQTVVYTVTPMSALGCVGNTFTVSVTVRPEPRGFNDNSPVVCSDVALSYDLSANVANTGSGGNGVSAGTTYSWIAASNPNVSGESDVTPGTTTTINDVLNNVTNTNQLVTYTVTPTSATGCVGDPFTVSVTVRPEPKGFNDATPVTCSDIATNYDLAANIANTGNGGNNLVLGTTFSWVAANNTNVGGESLAPQSGAIITDILNNVTTSNQVVVYTVTPTSSLGCVGNTFTVSITVRPEPRGYNDATPVVCSDGNVNYDLSANIANTGNGGNNLVAGTLYSWVAANNANVTGESTAPVATAFITDVLTNTTNANQTVVYTVTPMSALGCVGNTFTVSVLVRPEPRGFNDATTIVCSDVAFNYNLVANIANTGAGGNNLVAGTTFSWIAANNGNVTGETTGTPGTTSTITDVLTNVTNGNEIVVYTVTPTSSDGCVGDPFTVSITVRPEPKGFNDATPLACSDVAFNYDLNANIANTVSGGNNLVTGTTYSWVAASNPNVGGEGSGTGAIITDVLNNVTNSNQVVVYTVTPTSSLGCVGNTFTVSVTVRPEPRGFTDNTPITCSDVAFNYDLLANVANTVSGGNNLVTGTTFSWIAANNPNVTGESNVTPVTGSTINDVLNNITNVNQAVVYTVTPTSAAGCVGNTFIVTVTVRPEPRGFDDTTPVICSKANVNYNLFANIANLGNGGNNLVIGTTYTWVAANNPNVTGETLVTPATTATITDVLVNITNASEVVVYTVTPTSTNGCVGDPFTVSVTVLPEPKGFNDNTPIICSDDNVNYNLATNIANTGSGGNNLVIGTTYSWVAANNGSVGGESTTPQSGATINDVLNNVSNSDQFVVYTVTPTSSSGCVGNTFTVTITVRPEPRGYNDATPVICSDAAVAYDLVANVANVINGGNNLTAGTTFSWIAVDNPSVTGETTGVPGTTNTITDVLVNISGSNQLVVYTVTPTSGNSCVGNTFQVSVTVRSKPVGALDNTPQVCSDEAINYNIQTRNINLLGNGVASTFSYTVASSDAANVPVAGKNRPVASNAPITDVYTNLTNADVLITYTITPFSSPGTCQGAAFDVVFTVHPEPKAPATTNIAFCSDAAINFDLQTVVNTPVTGNSVLSKFKYTVVSSNGAAVPAGPNRNVPSPAVISDVYTNLTSADVVITYTVTPYSQANDCEGTPFTVAITIHPEPVGINITDPVCSSTLNHNIQTAHITNGVNSVFTYTVASSDGVAVPPGAPRVVASASPITDVYNNTSGTDVTITYTITPFSVANNCAGTPFTYSVTISSKPVGANSTKAPVCSDVAFNFDPQADITNGVISTFTWTVTYDPGITVRVAKAPQTGNIAETLTNTGAINLNAVYTITPTSGTCVGATYVITVPIRPEPVVASTLDDTKCSDIAYGNALNTNGVSIGAATYDVTALIEAGLGGTASTGTGAAAGLIATDAFTNQTSAQLKVTYTVIPNGTNGCIGDAKDITFRVNPEPVLAPQVIPDICSNNTDNPTTTGIVLGTNGSSVGAGSFSLANVEYKYVGDPTFSTVLPAQFTNAPTNAAVASTSNFNIVKNDKYTNMADKGVIVRYTVTSTSPAPQSCVGDPLTYEITINPQPTMDPGLNPTPVCSDVNSAVTLTTDPGPPISVAAASYIIRSINFAGLTPGPVNTGTGTGKPSNAIFNDKYVNVTANPLPATYEIAPVSAAGCVGVNTNITLTINPSPDLNVLPAVTCNDGTTGVIFSTTFPSDPNGVPAANYDVISITPAAGLTPAGGNVALGNGVASGYIQNDRFHNTTLTTKKVVYQVRPVSAATCRGPIENVEVTVEPIIEIVPNPASQALCGDGLIATNIQLTSGSVPTAGNISFNYAASASSGQVSGFAPIVTSLSNPSTIGDFIVNNSNTVQTVTYTVTPSAAGARNGAGCVGTPVPIVVTVEPKPKVTVPAAKTICENDAVNIVLNSATVPSTGAASVFVDVTATATGNVTGFVTPANFANGATLADVLVNNDPANSAVEYKFTPRFGTCVGTEVSTIVTVAPRPVIAPIANFDICSGEIFNPVAITVDTDPSSTFISWTVAADADISGESNGAGNSFSQVLFNNSGNAKTLTYTLSARNVANVPACNGSPVQLLVGVFPVPRVTGLPPSLNACNNESKVVNLTSSAAGTTFAWTVDNNSNPDLPAIAAGGGSSINQTFVNNGTSLGSYQYQITPTVVIPSNGKNCVGNDGIMVVNVAPPIVGQLYSSDGDATAFLCKGGKDFVFFDFGGLPLFEYSYSDGTTTRTVSGKGPIDIVTVNPTVTTTYTLLSVKDGFGCIQNPAGQTVTVNVGTTDANFTIDGPAIACSPYQVQFQHNQVSGVNYTWKWFDGAADSTYLASTNVTAQHIPHTFFNPAPRGTITYKVFLEAFLTDDYPGACKTTTQRSVQVYPTVAPAVFPDKDVICSDEQITFVNSSQGVTQHNWFYRVQGSTTPIDPKTTANVTFKMPNTTSSNPIVYEVVYQSTNGNCPAADVITPITVYRGVDAHFSNTTPTVFVGGHSFVTFTNDSQPVDGTDFRYEWDFGANGNPGTSQGVGPFNLDYTTPGPKEILLTATNILAEAAGLSCSDEFRKLITIVVPPLIADFTAIPLQACFPTDITITENKATGDKFAWRVIDNAGTAAQSNAELPVFKIPSPGKYTIELVTSNSFTGDQKTATKDVIIYDLPMASFDMRPGVVYVPDTELLTYNFSDGATSYEWDFGDGTIITDEKEPTHKYRIEGVYDVMLIAKNDHGGGVVCVDSLVRKVTAKQGGVTRVPNAFTPSPNGPSPSGPNANSFNDVFLPQVRGAEEFNMQVFDRWGNLVFESNSSNIGWDGYDRHGKLMPAGVYVYKLTLRLSDGQRTTQVGDITMIR